MRAGEVGRFDLAASKVQKVRNRDACVASVLRSDRILAGISFLISTTCISASRRGYSIVTPNGTGTFVPCPTTRTFVCKDARRDHRESLFAFRHYDDKGIWRSTRVCSRTDAEVERILYSGIEGRRGELKLQGAGFRVQVAPLALFACKITSPALPIGTISDVAGISGWKRGSWTCESNLFDGLENRHPEASRSYRVFVCDNMAFHGEYTPGTFSLRIYRERHRQSIHQQVVTALATASRKPL